MHSIINSWCYELKHVHTNTGTQSYTLNHTHWLVYTQAFTESFAIQHLHKSVYARTYALKQVHSSKYTQTYAINHMHSAIRTLPWISNNTHSTTLSHHSPNPIRFEKEEVDNPLSERTYSKQDIWAFLFVCVGNHVEKASVSIPTWCRAPGMEVMIASVRDEGMVMAVGWNAARSSTLCKSAQIRSTMFKRHTEKLKWAAKHEEMHRNAKYFMESGGWSRQWEWEPCQLAWQNRSPRVNIERTLTVAATKNPPYAPSER